MRIKRSAIRIGVGVHGGSPPHPAAHFIRVDPPLQGRVKEALWIALKYRPRH
jgi:hypothetical protein